MMFDDFYAFIKIFYKKIKLLDKAAEFYKILFYYYKKK